MNIYDIAEKCGVSIATVSRVLNNNPNVSAATRERILAVINEENYTPSALARSLGNGAAAPTATSAPSAAVAILCSDLIDARNAAVVAAVEAHLRDKGKAVLLRGCDHNGESAALGALTGNAEAIVYVDPLSRPAANDPILSTAATTPILLVDGYVAAPNVSCVRTDVRAAVMELIRQILRRQRRRILLLVGGRTCACAEMVGGYEDAYAAAGITVDPELVIAVENTPEQVNTCLKKLLISRVTFDAVLCTDSVLALSAQKALQRTGLNLPLIGLSDSLAARCSSPALTCADCDTDTLCKAVCDALDKLPATEDVLIPTRLNERDTFRNA
ncbi:MAG: LacI family DNA-binding transcriptional regulator [Clostridia bacterium]|nr:LacI family DNA-binding transcriptional regulator [Clostridia bacterium]